MTFEREILGRFRRDEEAVECEAPLFERGRIADGPLSNSVIVSSISSVTILAALVGVSVLSASRLTAATFSRGVSTLSTTGRGFWGEEEKVKVANEGEGEVTPFGEAAGGDGRKRGLAIDFAGYVGIPPAKPNLLGVGRGRGLRGEATAVTAWEPDSGTTSSKAFFELMLGCLNPDGAGLCATALAFAAARLSEETVGAANPALDRVLLARFSPIDDAGVVMFVPVVLARDVAVLVRLGARERREDTDPLATLDADG